jgi:hypothetical protein
MIDDVKKGFKTQVNNERSESIEQVCTLRNSTMENYSGRLDGFVCLFV